VKHVFVKRVMLCGDDVEQGGVDKVREGGASEVYSQGPEVGAQYEVVRLCFKQ
jgi:hypothetical protein